MYEDVPEVKGVVDRFLDTGRLEPRLPDLRVFMGVRPEEWKEDSKLVAKRVCVVRGIAVEPWHVGSTESKPGYTC